ncbi:MAG: UDP-N-acetylmuramate dehydrogenase [Thermoleophilia bacterium]|nr:UDP-N-acetylmuramate dehydrogenase [Thermoleophilia bacterium]
MARLTSLGEKLRMVAGASVFPDVALAPLTTFGTGGNADLLVEVETAEAASSVLAILEELGVEWVCLGLGSNVLVADEGLRGVVIKLGSGLEYVRGLPERPQALPLGQPLDGAEASSCRSKGTPIGNEITIRVGGAIRLTRLARLASYSGLSGLEFACGIPGTLGGAVACNAGAHGACMRDAIRELEIATPRGVETVPASSLEWTYRCCTLPRAAIVTAAEVALSSGDPAVIRERHYRFLQHRRATQPRGVRTFGSVFKNPPGHQAGRLLEEAGVKGLRVGGVEVSRVHANFLENRGNATTRDALFAMALMREAVLARSGILLEPEVRVVGTRFLWDEDG